MKDSAGEDTRSGVYVSADEVHELAGSRGVANFVLKWAKDSKREAYLNIEEVKNVTRPLTGRLLIILLIEFLPLAGTRNSVKKSPHVYAFLSWLCS